MKKIIFCFSFVCMGLLSSCVDKNELVDEDAKPDFLGGSIYDELQNSADNGSLSGTFNTYLRLVEDVGYADVLKRTGSKTVFAANDEAFARFFNEETWPGVRKYEDLSTPQKKLLINSSMLDNALLVGMLSNVMSSGELTSGMALKHKSTIDKIDSVTYYPGATVQDVYKNNTNWSRFNKGVALVSDKTTPMLVHFTKEYMDNNGITTFGTGSDFSILVGGDYQNGDTYIYRNRVVNSDVTCQNGYIHQVQNVIIPPGNMASVMKKANDLTIISHLFDRFAVPVYNSQLTYDYKSWYKAEQDAGHNMNGYQNVDSIFEVRYISEASQGNEAFTNKGQGGEKLAFDIGWNEYYTGNADQSLMDIAALFVPNDATIQEYFVNGAGKPIIERYCGESGLPNTPENVIKNVDYIPTNVVNKLLSNMMQSSFRSTVPSKFEKITDNESGDFMGITVDELARDNNGDADVRISNNGVIYVMNRVLSPNSYDAVSAPTLFNTNMNIINWIIENKVMNGSSTNPYSLGLDFYAYLLAMKANFALFLPTDEAFELCYIDPARLNRAKSTYGTKNGPIAVKYKWRGVLDDPKVRGVIHAYNPETHEIGDSVDALNFSSSTMNIVRTQLSDLMNYCTIVLDNGRTLGDNGNVYYKAKNGGELKIDMVNKTVSAGGQLFNGVRPSNITNVYSQANGKAYTIDHLIQTPLQSVYSVLSDAKKYPQFSDFFEVCSTLSNSQLIKWALDKDDELTELDKIDVNSYRVFTDKAELPNCLDYNVRFFNMYNYTVYVPNNQAMEAAHAAGLPFVSEIMDIYENDVKYEINDPVMKKVVKGYLASLRDFVYYHFQNTSVYIDKNIEGMNYNTFLVDAQLKNVPLSVSGGNDVLRVTDAAGITHNINGNGIAVNVMTRDYQFEKGSTPDNATYVDASSFAVIHEISQPLHYRSNGKFDTGVSNAKSRRMSVVR